MAQYAVASGSSRPMAPASIAAQAPCDGAFGNLVYGVAAQDALVALFDEVAHEEALEPCACE